ncbi:copper resistance protein NlpE N-terminal domain-containing protein [Candidatus Uhrbacteria bacterium]|nr:copper resistance protein NlpE N-terminal domain-containing protein [Candidatus Uhrbacteria bacterium]
MKKERRAFGIGMTAWVIGIVAIIVFILLLAFVPRNLIAPENGRLESAPAAGDQATSGTMRFVGLLPCDDCEGIRTELELRPNGTFTIEETYIGKIATQPHFQIGNWTTLRGTARDLKAVIYQINHDRLEGSKYFLVLADGNIRLLDNQQNDIVSSLNYMLERQK